MFMACEHISLHLSIHISLYRFVYPSIYLPVHPSDLSVKVFYIEIVSTQYCKVLKFVKTQQ